MLPYGLTSSLVSPAAMRDRAQALLRSVEADRGRLHSAHGAFLRQLGRIYSDL